MKKKSKNKSVKEKVLLLKIQEIQTEETGDKYKKIKIWKQENVERKKKGREESEERN